MSLLDDLYASAGVTQPAQLASWCIRVDEWCDQYARWHGTPDISAINVGVAVFLFDHRFDRVTLAYAVSDSRIHRRDRARMRGFPDVNIGVRATLGDQAFAADRGHFLGHASGGELDINLFPHRRALNRGWSDDGKRFRAMERFVAQNPGCFFYHRPEYDDDSWIPAALTYGLLGPDGAWREERFQNKRPPVNSRADR